jgi:enoyl-CoA hydratase/carnithine racemase
MRCEEWLAPITHKPTQVLQAYKEIAIEKWEQSRVWNRMEQEIHRCSILWESPEHEEAVQKVIVKKT